MRIRIAVPEEHADPAVIDAALEAVTRLDESLIRSGQSPTATQLVEKGARWRPENMGDEHFDHGATIAQRGWGDCDDWAPLRAAELRTTGQDPGAVARVVPSGPSTYHAMVQRSSGELERGDADISARAGMKPLKVTEGVTVVGGGEVPSIEVWACDPHDGRFYQGSLLPTVGPLSLHCGPQVSVRGARGLYEGRCDLPMAGSSLVGARHRRGTRVRHRRVHGGMVPYALSSTALGPTREHAMSAAILGAVLCGEASGMVSPLDRYKMIAHQGALHRMHPQAICEAVADRLITDVTRDGAAQNIDPAYLVAALARQLGPNVPPDPMAIAAEVTKAAVSGGCRC